MALAPPASRLSLKVHRLEEALNQTNRQHDEHMRMLQGAIEEDLCMPHAWVNLGIDVVRRLMQADHADLPSLVAAVNEVVDDLNEAIQSAGDDGLGEEREVCGRAPHESCHWSYC